MKFRQLLSALYQKYSHPKSRMVKAVLLGRELLVHEGTVHKEDKDDAWFLALAYRSDTMYDIGCNIGSAALIAAMTGADKHIVLADPNPLAIKMAEENLAANNLLANKTFVTAFVAEKAGQKQKFYTIGTGAAGSMFASHARSASLTRSYYMVDTTSIDEIVKQTGIVPDLVKIDVEGAESMALQGATELARYQKAMIMVEMHGPEEMPMLTNAALVLEWCRANNYKAYYLSKHVALTEPQQLADRGRCHLLLLPVGVGYPDYLKGIHEGAPLDSARYQN